MKGSRRFEAGRAATPARKRSLDFGQRGLRLGQPFGGLRIARKFAHSGKVRRRFISLPRLPRSTVLVESLGEDELIRRIGRKQAYRGLGMNQSGFGVARACRPTRGPQQDQRHDPVAAGKVELRSNRNDLSEQLHHDLEAIDGCRGPFARLLSYGQRKPVGALRHRRVKADAVLADLDTLDGKLLSALSVFFVLNQPGGGPRRTEKGLDGRRFGSRSFEVEGQGLLDCRSVRPLGELVLRSGKDGIHIRGPNPGPACISTDRGDRRRLLESRSARAGYEQ